MRKYYAAEQIELVHSGRDYFSTLERIINNAREVLHLQTYIFQDDITGQRVTEQLINAALRGVNVFVLIDTVGSYPFSTELVNRLTSAGVRFRFFAPVLSAESLFIGRRLHHKVVVADQLHALVGGINIADKYNSINGEDPWLDYAVYTKGALNEYLHLYCEQFYFRKRRDTLLRWERTAGKSNDLAEAPLVRYRRNDWIRQRVEIHRSYKEALIRADTSITLIASYFLPGNNFRKLIRKATARGVHFRVLMAGKSDIPFMRKAETYLYDYYLRYGVEIYEWQGTMLHGKAMLVDDTWATIGSYNLNFLSKYASSELNADILDQSFIKNFSGHLDRIIATDCRRIDLSEHKRSGSILRKAGLFIAYNFYRFVMNFMMFGGKFKRKFN